MMMIGAQIVGKRTVRTSVQVALAATLVFGLVACGASPGGGQSGKVSSSPNAPVEVTVGGSPAISIVSLYQAMTDGAPMKNAGIHVPVNPRPCRRGALNRANRQIVTW